MPFTFSHPAIVLPLNYLPKKLVSMTGLIIGSMIPDFEYFMRMSVKSLHSHSLLGLFWFDLPLGVVVVLLYNKFIKDVVIDHLPISLNKRLSIFKGNSYNSGFLKYFLIISICVLIGAASHLLWDGFTHPSGYFVHHIPFLRHKIHFNNHEISVYNIAQHISSIIGMLIILRVVFTLPMEKNTQEKKILSYWATILTIALFTIVFRFINGVSWHQLGDVVVTGISGSLIGFTIVSLIYFKSGQRLENANY